MRLRSVVAAGMGLLSALAGAQSVDERAELRKLDQQARAAHQRQDFPEFLELTRKVVAKVPRSVGALYNLACAQALNGARAEAIATLDRLAERGVAFDLAADPDLDGLRGEPGFEAVGRKMEALDEPVGSSTVAFTLADETLITEGIARDPGSGDFFVSSIRHRKIVRVSKGGKLSDFFPSGRDGFYSVVALDVDPSRKALWASSEASPRMEGFRAEDEGRSFVAELDLTTSKLRRRIDPPRLDPAAHLSDLAVGPAGDIAVSDPYTGRIYILPAGAEALQVLVDVGPLVSPQGISWSPDGKSLFVADYAQGIARVSVEDGAVQLLEIPRDAVVTGIDGLVWAEGSLVGIQNGIRPHRVIRLRLDPSLDRIEEIAMLERGHPSFDEPTLGVRVGSDLYYVANSQYRFVRDDGTLDLDRLQPPVILRAPLPWIRERIRYDREYPAIGYSSAVPSDPVARLRRKIEAGDERLSFDPERGYLASLLEALRIPLSSQVLVFTRTSLQKGRISPRAPRAIYFGDDTYVAWVPGGPSIEISSVDPILGAVFYTLGQEERERPAIERETVLCLQCHDSHSLTGGGVPRHIMGSGIPDASGRLAFHEGWSLTTDETPLERRWGGWYVTGTHGSQRHMGNAFLEGGATTVDFAAGANVTALDKLIDTGPYLGKHSDIVALLVLEHQVHVQNLITRVHWDTRSSPSPPIERLADPLARALLFLDQAPIESPIGGTSGFAADFVRRGPRDSKGRSLRDLDLERRLFRYPVSYLVYSESFDALPRPAREYLYRRIREALVSSEDGKAAIEILQATKLDFAASAR
jgi:sugar lactone lactonase YvrE